MPDSSRERIILYLTFTVGVDAISLPDLHPPQHSLRRIRGLIDGKAMEDMGAVMLAATDAKDKR